MDPQRVEMTAPSPGFPLADLLSALLRFAR